MQDHEPYVPAVIPPDPARDARVAARRRADAARAGRALDRLLGGECSIHGTACAPPRYKYEE